MPEVSVVVPTHNRAHLLPRALASVRRQGLTDHEVVVVDDGSTDATADVLAGIDDPRVRVIRTRNRGVAAARNTAIRASSGRWIAFLDDDNEWRPSFLETLTAAAESAGSPAAYGAVEWVDDRTGSSRVWPERFPAGDVFDDLVDRWHPFLSGVVVLRALLLEIGAFDLRLRGFEDYDLLMRVARDHDLAAVGEPLAIRHDRHGRQVTRDAGALAAAARRIARRHGAIVVRRTGWRQAARWRCWLAGIAALEDVKAVRSLSAGRLTILRPAARLARGLPWTGADGVTGLAALVRGRA